MEEGGSYKDEGEKAKSRSSEWGKGELQSTIRGGGYKRQNEVQDEARERNGGQMRRRLTEDVGKQK